MNEKSLETGGWTLVEIWEGHVSLQFTPPMRVDYSVWAVDDKTVAYVTYDFGMGFEINLSAQRKSWWNYGSLTTESTNGEIVNAIIRFDLFHAFTHYQGDPNYSHLHWALYGNLRERCKVIEHEDLVENENNNPPT